jgi:quercetin dioxygenase-like cupin family protein
VQLAQSAALSHPFLSQIERGLARPSITSLERIAFALGSSPVELIAAGEEEPGAETAAPRATIVRAGSGTVGAFGAGRARVLVEGPHRFQVLEFEGQDAPDGAFHSHAEDEFITVTGGSVAFEIDGEAPTVLAIGDSAYHRSGVRHRWGSADGEVYRLLIVKENPGRAASDGRLR